VVVEPCWRWLPSVLDGGGRGAPSGYLTEYQCFRNGVARQAVGAARAADRFASRQKTRDVAVHVFVHADTAHVIVGDGRYLNRRGG